MRLLILTIFFNLIICSMSFAQKSTTAGVKCKVNYPDIELFQYSGDINKTMFPGTRTERLKFKWQYRGGKDLSCSIIGGWTQELGEHFFLDLEDWKNFNENRFNPGDGKSLPIIYHFRINCKPGTPKGTYTGIYTITISYN